MKQSPLFSNIQTGEAVYDDVDRATYKGITIKTVILLLISVLIAAVIAFALPTILTNNSTTFYVTLVVSSIVGFISVIVGRSSERKAKYAAVIYAICEGLFLGSLSAIVEAYVPGVVKTAVFSTIVLFAVMLTLFATGVIRVGSKFRSICFGLTLGALAIILLVSLFSLFVDYQTYFGIMIGVEVFLVFYGVITLSLNFAEANAVVSMGASKDAEWSVALGLLVSIIYIYIEIVRLLALLAARSDN
ncbi:MAG: Bax inhibitor-1/YccA family protein [Roseburia sp.]|nr:Bax inhibitor-1/YccA family protein [Anaeroplasma bactoclasticum]MCM1196049.1 Bax inhibitor-1/YccA family protein [Roseburia sp.]MCM1556734.1 Bax inhibitor-1/YccA family protein [Anaeroplasma bactoclasticum]